MKQNECWKHLILKAVLLWSEVMLLYITAKFNVILFLFKQRITQSELLHIR